MVNFKAKPKHEKEELFNIIRFKSNNPLLPNVEAMVEARSLFSADVVVHAANQPSHEASIIIINGTVLFMFRNSNNIVYDPFHVENI